MTIAFGGSSDIFTVTVNAWSASSRQVLPSGGEKSRALRFHVIFPASSSQMIAGEGWRGLYRLVVAADVMWRFWAPIGWTDTNNNNKTAGVTVVSHSIEDERCASCLQ